MILALKDITNIEQFLGLPELKPALEYIGGKVVQKMTPVYPHSVLQLGLANALNAFAQLRGLGEAGVEIRAVFGGSSPVPDVSFFVAERVPQYVRKQMPSLITYPPDICVEILSPGQRTTKLRRKIRHSLKHGSRLGWLVDMFVEEIAVLRPGRRAQVLKVGDVLSGEDVLPGFSISLEEIFSWLDRNRPRGLMQ
jgi:Uma2 family endonuclease